MFSYSYSNLTKDFCIILPLLNVKRFHYLVPSDIKLKDNVKVLNWIPQNDILGHPKTKAFVGHMGVNGAYEAAYHGIPVVAVPLMSDAYDNTIRLTEKGRMAKVIDIHTATVETWVNIIKEVIYDPR